MSNSNYFSIDSVDKPINSNKYEKRDERDTKIINFFQQSEHTC